jgi:TonB-linked SusC/RagA family outer membrane protein
MFRKLLSLALLMSLALPVYTFAQSITGTITDSQTGEPLAGANVLVQELQRGASTNLEGEYVVPNVPAGQYNLRVTYLGYATITRSVTVGPDGVVANFQLREDFLGLEEVIVTALGIEREARSIGYAVQTLDGASILRSQRDNLVDALSGQFSGVNVAGSSGQPGAATRIVIRGHTSMLGNNQPLFVIDGVPISNAGDNMTFAESTLFQGGTSNRGLDLDPNIIENITVLKGASATALYGSRAAAGAIIISTRGSDRGERPPQVQFSSTVRASEAIIDGYQTEYTLGNQGFYVSGHPMDRGGFADPRPFRISNGDTIFRPFGPTFTQTTVSWGPHKDDVPQEIFDLHRQNFGEELTFRDPRKDFYETGIGFDNSVSLSGGSATTNYFLSYSNLQQKGIVPGTKLDRNSVMARFGSQLGESWNVSTSVNFVRTDNIWLREGNGTRAYNFGLNFAPINVDLRPVTYDDGFQIMNSQAFNNPFWLSENNRFTSEVNRFIGNTQVTYNVTDWLTISERLGIDTYSDIRKEEVNVGTRGRPAGQMFDQRINRTEINSDFTISALYDISEDLRINGLVGHNLNMRTVNQTFQRGEGLNVPDFYHVGNATEVTPYQETLEQNLVSVYSQITLDYGDYLYLTLTGRNDWSSTLPEDNRSYFYPSASVGFVFTDAIEPLRNNQIISFGKLRASVAQIGADAPVYSLSTTYAQAGPTDAVRGVINFPFRGRNAFLLGSNLGNPELKPEISTEWEVGLETRFLNDRVVLDVAYYDRTIKDQIFNVPVSSATGYMNVLMNAGELRNHGIEIDMGVTPIQTRDFRWNIRGNFSNPTTEVVALAEGVESIYLAGFTDPQVRIMPDKNGYGIIWSNRFQRNEDGALLIGDNGLPLEDPELGPIGNVQPDWLANIRTSFNYRGIGLSGLLDIRQGGDVLNMDLFYSSFYGTAGITSDRGSTYVYDGIVASTGQPNTQEIVRDQNYYWNHYGNIFEYFVEDGSYVRLRELSLSYALPMGLLQRTPFRSLEFSATGYNLWISTDFSYGDPEGSLYGSGNGQGFYHAVTPNTRQYSFSVRFSL